MTEQPRVTVTFLFTDIEGSTQRWEQQPESMRAALSEHDRVLRETIEASGGWFIKHTGDGVVAAFATAGAAIDAAIAAQRHLELPVRMAIWTGEAELRDGDYFGPTVNRAARTMSAAHGGQILVAASTAALVDRTDLVDLGLHRLRDLSQPQRLFQLRAGGLREAFPPPKTLNTAPGNLPAQATSFLGRDKDLVEIAALLRTSRLVTLTGVGGVGKTRLAIQVAADISQDYHDGIWLVELAALGDAQAIGHAVAGVLGIAQQPEMTIERSIVRTWQQVLAALDGQLRALDRGGSRTLHASSDRGEIIGGARSRHGFSGPKRRRPVLSLGD